MQRYICIHGHFYQPPRENPWIEAIDLQDSAYPYHDWNRRITAECYAPNAKSRILDDQNRILKLVNNYARISFNFGPTLLTWLERNVPWVYASILEADRKSMTLYSGHGSALAQSYNHLIMPLANRRDKVTQVLWGIWDFRQRFQRPPEGMWLPETAVDLETLEIMAEQHIRFTILSPYQARGTRPLSEKTWKDVNGGGIDPTRAYRIRLPSGRTMALFFYDGAISRAVAFEKILNSGEAFAQRLTGAFSDTRNHAQLVHIATDGESYGHHHRFGDMALSYALGVIEAEDLARLTNYGEYLEKYPPTHEVEIIENTSWSCAHGLDRWRSHCGCHTGLHPEWNQDWRRPLRDALDFLRDALIPAYEEKTRAFLKDPWEAREQYIRVIRDRSPAMLDAFLGEHAGRGLGQAEKGTAFQLLELQRHAMLMYTSCGWFFDELSGIETIQILQYAGRVLQLAREALEMELKEPFLKILEQARSNLAENGDGRQIYQAHVESAEADLKRVCAHYAVSSLFKDYEDEAAIYCYGVERENYRIIPSGKTRLIVGRATLSSRITTVSSRLTFCALHLGDHNILCGVRDGRVEEGYRELLNDISETFSGGDLPETIRRIDKQFGASIYSLNSLFRDEQRRILDLVMAPALSEAENTYRQLHAHYAPVLRFLKASNNPPPKALSSVVEFLINADLERVLGTWPLDMGKIRELLQEGQLTGANLEKQTLEYALRKSLESASVAFSRAPEDLDLLQGLDAALGLQDTLPFEVNLWTIQNTCYGLLKEAYPAFKNKAEQGDKKGLQWMKGFSSLAEKLSLKMP